jgi:predicted RecA/RadA family phage recombinase
MARNFVQPGDVITLTAPVAVKSGGVVHVGALIGVAAYDAPEGAEVETALTGVFELPKGKAALEQGELAYWDATAKTVTSSAGENGLPLLGAVVAGVGADAGLVRIRLNGITS